MQLRTKQKFSLDPRTKILLLLLGNVLLFSYGNVIYLHMLTAFALLLTTLLGKGKNALQMAVFCLSVYGISYIMGFAPHFLNSMWGLLVLPIMMFIPLFALAYLLFTTTQISEIISALQKLHCPSFIITPLIVMFRFFPTLKLELQSIRDAMKLKGIRKNPIKLLEYVYAPLLFNCVKIGDELNISGVTRGLGLYNTSTQTAKIKFGILDISSIIIVVMLIILRKGVIAL